MLHVRLSCATLCLLALFAGCSSAGAATAGVRAITVTANEYKFNPGTIRVKPGERVSITLKNEGALLHSFILKDKDFDFEEKADPGQSETMQVVIPRAGEYKFLCDVPGHANMGMGGVLIVE